MRGIAFGALLIGAVAGVFLAVSFAGLSIMAFDAPNSGKLVWPYVLVLVGWLNLPLAGLLTAWGVKAMRAGRAARACLFLVYPATLPLAFILWVHLP